MAQAAWQRWLDRVRLHPGITTAAQWLAEFWSLVFPAECVACGRPDHSLCPDCTAALRRATVRPYRAEKAAEALPEAEALPGTAARAAPAPADATAGDPAPVDAAPAEFVPLPVLAAGRYRRELSQVILAFKNHGHTDLVPVLAAALGGALHCAVAQSLAAADRAPAGLPGSGTVVLVPVPSRAASIRRRGYDPVHLLLRRLEARRLLPAAAELAPAVGHTAASTLRDLVPGPLRTAVGWAAGSQKTLGRTKRRGNVAGTLVLRRKYAAALAGRNCLIVDDVLTTGATIAEMTRVLRRAGVRVTGAAVLAATQAPGGAADGPGSPCGAAGNDS